MPGAAAPLPTPPLLLTPGDPAGIGGEIALKSWKVRQAEGVPVFAVLDDPDRLNRLGADLGWDVPVREISAPIEAAEVFDRALPVLRHDFPAPVKAGRPDPANGAAVAGAIDRAVGLVRRGEGTAVVTNPISKHVLQNAGFRHPGHTEYLAALAGGDGPPPRPVMMLACPGVRVVPVTIHIALKDVPGTLSREVLQETARITHAALHQDFGIAAPRLAVAGLNPHAGEDGRMGREEIEMIAPALDELRAEGLTVAGPLPADTMFHPAAREGYDAALCMYHDQALIPVKTLDFARGVNVTLGLPFVRTSPDHGTAFGIAGRGTADPTSLIEALKTAREMAAHRGWPHASTSSA
jgi:4-hydroxythreonine-4-phosphate dehydrogenase